MMAMMRVDGWNSLLALVEHLVIIIIGSRIRIFSDVMGAHSLCPGWIKYANYISIFMAPGGIENV